MPGRRKTRVAMAALPLAAPSLARAQPWRPDRPVEMPLAYAPGGAADVLARAVARKIEAARGRRWKLTLELKSGAGGLCDLEADPFETTNRFEDAGAAEARRRLEGAIRARPDDAGPLRTPVGTA